MNFKDMNLSLANETTTIKVAGDIELAVRNYLPIDEKAQLIQFVVNGAVDDATGTFSPLRVEVFFSLGLCRWYGGISFEDVKPEEISSVYDALDQSGTIDAIARAIPEDEFAFMNDLVRDTIDDIARYNNSFAGVMQIASENTDALNNEVTEIMGKIKNGEGMEQLAVIKDVVG